MTGSGKILILAANGLRAGLVEQLARHREFSVAASETAAEAERLLVAEPPDMLLVDAAIGVEFAHWARPRFEGRILLIGAEANGASRAFEPCFDHIDRPFRFVDLLARLRAGRAQIRVAIGAYRFRPGAMELTGESGGRLPLTEKEAELLTRLIAAEGAVIAKDVLLREIWGYHPSVRTRTLETHVSRLRRKIEPSSSDRLLVAENGGYRLISRRL